QRRARDRMSAEFDQAPCAKGAGRAKGAPVRPRQCGQCQGEGAAAEALDPISESGVELNAGTEQYDPALEVSEPKACRERIQPWHRARYAREIAPVALAVPPLCSCP